MLLEALLAQLQAADTANKTLVINDTNAETAGLDIDEVKSLFYQETGRVILTNENIKVHFDKEGGHLDFSTFDGVSVSVDYTKQSVAPNKGGDGFER